MDKVRRYIVPLIWALAYLSISSVIGFVTRQNMNWYGTLEKASLTPPDIAFPIVWTGLYVLLALAGWRVWQRRKEPDFRPAFYLYWIQIIMNWGWSFVFFQAHFIAIGFFWIVVLDFLMIAFISFAWKTDRAAALLVLPTVLWGSFAAYLNYSIWILN
jgi:benzodiazapine receptor